MTCNHWGIRNFEREVEDHLKTGFVHVLPNTFLMAKAVEFEDGRRAWLITHAIGNLRYLIATMPWPLEWIALRRRQDRRMRLYRLERFLEISSRAPARDHNHNRSETAATSSTITITSRSTEVKS